MVVGSEENTRTHARKLALEQRFIANLCVSGGGKTERRGVGVSDYCKVESHDCFGSSCTVIVFAAVGRISDCF